jgi:hypothetical protein
LSHTIICFSISFLWLRKKLSKERNSCTNVM